MEEMKNTIVEDVNEDNVVEVEDTEVVESVETEEESTEETSEEDTEGVTLSPSDYKIVVSMLREMEDQYEMTEKSVHNAMENRYRLSPEVLDLILPYELESIKDLDAEDMRNFLTNNCMFRDDTTYREMRKSQLVEVMTAVKEASLLLLNTKSEADKLKEESADVLREYFNYMSSDKIKASRMKRLEAMKKALELETDPYQSKKIKEMIDAMEASMNFTFLQKRFERYGDKEIKNIMEGFFDDKRGSYIIDRYKDKIRRFGFNPEVYRYFFNIEENFLAKKYSPFNNLFLFIYMRMVAYSDVNSKVDNLLVHSITGALANLIYHKFNSTESEQYFLQVVGEILDRFEDNSDYFVENNRTYEEHPDRKEAEMKHEEKRRRHLMTKMDRMQIKGYDPEWTGDELLEYFNKENELLVKKQLDKNKEVTEELEIEGSEIVESIEDESVETDIVEEETSVEDVKILTELDASVEDEVETEPVEIDEEASNTDDAVETVVEEETVEEVED